MFRLVHLLLLLLLLTYQLVVQAADDPGVITREEDRSKRTLFRIIWGCVSTTIICTWAAVHPNIPPQEGPLKGALRRLELMFWAIVAPEILPCWALNQRLAAMTVRDVYKDRKCKTKSDNEREKCEIWKSLKRWLRKGVFLLPLPMNVLVK